MRSLSKIYGPGRRAILSIILTSALFSFCFAFGFSGYDQPDQGFPASYLARNYTITASAGPGGSISPSGKVVVKRGHNETFAISAHTGYDLLDVAVDGESIGAVPSYEFSDVNSDHTISATFSKKTFTITASAGTGGNISPSGEVSVDFGSDQEFTITPHSGYKIKDVLVDDVSIGPVADYTFTDISSDHSIGAAFNGVIEVLNVSIDNDSMKIGDVVPATITVENDAGIPYTLISGSIGGYPLTGFQRISATTYGANFSINQGGNSFSAEQDIPVSNLVISNGMILSPPYNLPIIQNNDPIDGALPVISSMQTEGGNKKIGDVISLNINADGSGYKAHPLSMINGIDVSEPQINFTESGGGKYVLNYTIQEGDTDVGPGQLQVSVILVKPSGNVGLPYTALTGASTLSIDAHAPVVKRLVVPSIEVGIGGTVKVKITADGAGYIAGTGTTVNGVAVGSPRMAFTEYENGLYELSYTVGTGDAAVAPGNLQASIALTDAAGNTGRPYGSLEPNNLEIYTDLPEAWLGGTSPICEGDKTQLSVFLRGRSPWSFDLNDGTTTTSYKNITSSDYKITIAPLQTTTYQISSLTDVNGVENTAAGNLKVTVNNKTRVEIINLAAGYTVDAEPVKLEANVTGGTFSGPGVFSATGYFYPGIADTINSPHTIYYTYKNISGCTSVASKLVHVTGYQAVILILGNTFCSKDDPFPVTVLNIPGVTGSYRLLDSASKPVAGLTDHRDNTATIDPGLLIPSDYTIEFQYFDTRIHYLKKPFKVESAGEPLILNFDEVSYCQNEAPFLLQSNLENVIFEGPGVSGNVDDGFIFNPGDANPGNISITCTTNSGNSCKASTVKSALVLFAPEVRFSMNAECLPEGGEIVSFDNRTIGKSSVEFWSWDFGDPASGENNRSNQSAPSHFYRDPGQKNIGLTATTYGGCEVTTVQEFIIDSQPVADFTWISDCFKDGSGVKFVNRSINVSASPDTIIWTFKNSAGDVLGERSSTSTIDTVEFRFAAADNYQIGLYTVNKGGCFSELTKEIMLRPTIELGSEGYRESFDQSEGLWIVRSEDQVQSWVWDVPDFKGHTQAAGDKAWFTRLPSGTTPYRENSWMQSPCFDFSEANRPMIRMDMMRSFIPYTNGAVLQYQDVIEEGWKNVGENTPGIEWYNADYIHNKPGGSSIGWGLEIFNPDTDWVTAKHDLDELNGKPNVSLRMAIATNGDQGIGNQGFAFDNVVISERTKLAVLEYFTNSSDLNSRAADELVDAFALANRKDVVDLQYHADYPGVDPMNLNDPRSAFNRAGNLGVGQRIPYAVLDGGFSDRHHYDFSGPGHAPHRDELKLITLESPHFTVDLEVDWTESDLVATTTVTCENDNYPENIQLFVVVFESLVTAYTGGNGDKEFRNVVVQMLPDSRGKLLGNNWTPGKSVTQTNNWIFEPYVENIDDLAVAAFIQDRSTFQILQAAVDYKNKMVGIGNPVSEIRALNVYPNPGRNIIYLNLGERTERPGRIELMDIQGKVLIVEQLPAGYQIFQLDIDRLNPGMYILLWTESAQVKGVAKIVKSR